VLSKAPARVPLARVAQVHGRRHGAEEALQAGKGEVGLAHDEVRSWVGWHQHMTLSLLALWFLVREKQRLGEKIPALTVSQLREVFARLLPPATPLRRLQGRGRSASGSRCATQASESRLTSRSASSGPSSRRTPRPHASTAAPAWG
jgi:hypothetical protein